MRWGLGGYNRGRAGVSLGLPSTSGPWVLMALSGESFPGPPCRGCFAETCRLELDSRGARQDGLWLVPGSGGLFSEQADG